MYSTSLSQSWDRQFVQYHPNLHADAVACSLVQTGDRLVERAFRLNHVIVGAGKVGIKRNAEADIRVPNLGKSSCILRPSECSSIREHVQFCFRHRQLELRNQLEKIVAEECGFSARDRQVRRVGRYQADQFKVALRERLDIVPILRRLRTHQAIAVAPLGDKQ